MSVLGSAVCRGRGQPLGREPSAEARGVACYSQRFATRLTPILLLQGLEQALLKAQQPIASLPRHALANKTFRALPPPACEVTLPLAKTVTI